MSLPADILKAREGLASELLPSPPDEGVDHAVPYGLGDDVIGLGIGRLDADASDGEGYFLRAYVSGESAVDEVPSEYEGIPVRAEVVGRIRAASASLPLSRLRPGRPVAGGVSIGHCSGETGTLGSRSSSQAAHG